MCGAGVLVRVEAALHVITCAHVVTAADGQHGPVVVDLPGRGWSAPARSLAAAWSPAPLLDARSPGVGDAAAGADFAVLAVEAGRRDLPPGAAPAILAACGDPDDRSVSIIGYPRGAPAGLIATARLAGRGGPHPGWMQLTGLLPTGPVVERGFSGAAVWDASRQGVIGLVTAAHGVKEVRAAWMLPIEVAIECWPPLAQAPAAPTTASPCRPPTRRQRYELADALLEVPQIAFDSGRMLREELPPQLRHGIRDHPVPRQQLVLVVDACIDHQGGCRVLRNAVTDLGGGSRSASTAVELLERSCCELLPGSA